MYGIAKGDHGLLDRAAVICGIADHLVAMGDNKAAEANYREALAISPAIQPSSDLPNGWFLGGIYRKLGLLAYQNRQWKEAQENFRQSLAISTDIGDLAGQADAFRDLGRAAARLHDWPQARRRTRKPWRSTVLPGRSLGPGRSLHFDLARAASDCGRLDEAKQACQQALSFFMEFGDQAGEAAVHHNLGDIAQEEMRYKRAWKHYRKAIKIFHNIGDRGGQRGYNRLGVLMWRKQDGEDGPAVSAGGHSGWPRRPRIASPRRWSFTTWAT